MAAEVVHVPLEYLALAPENTRQEPDPEALEALKASIREQGLLQNLVGYEAGERVLVVAGGHRLRALMALAAEGHPVGEVPVRLVPRQKALVLSVTENLQRKDLSPLEEALAVAELAKAGLAPEDIARELGRSPAYVRTRLAVAQGLAPSWREALHGRAIPLALAAELAELPEAEQEALYRQHGTGLKPETVRALKLKDAVPVRRLLPGVREAYLAAGGVLEANLEGEERALDRPLALRLQEEAARTLAGRLGAELLLDVPFDRIQPAVDGQGRNLVVLQTATLEVRTFVGVRLLGEGRKGEAPKPIGAALPPAEAGPKPGTRPEPKAEGGGAREITAAGMAERTALWVRAARERALSDATYAQAALVLGVLEAFRLARPRKTAYFRSRPASEIHGLALDDGRWRELSGEDGLRKRLEEVLREGGVDPKEATLEALLALPAPALEEAFRLALALLVGLPSAENPPVPTLGMADAKHLSQFSEAVLNAALAEMRLAVAGAARKKDKVAALLARPQAPYPEALRRAGEKG
ncbi:ParB/RepB/Spo0J family partition protein [Thermus scotoductus]|uniref:ParB/RepB/Spo0J family partition protein n=1 Tax=Thermus scotoductus TaxID=37636 RepID=UPI0015623D87|nr:ParB/Srx family N-terminal domain-containing protein [Thermus scotoductus]